MTLISLSSLYLKRCALIFLLVWLSACVSAKKRPSLSNNNRIFGKTLPLIIAHRAGTEDYPENTLLAIHEALKNGADLIWLTVQLSKDHVPVLYRPADLSAWTAANGSVADKTLAELQQLNAGWNFASMNSKGNKTYPYRFQTVRIPTLREALRLIPRKVSIILDMKALPAQKQTEAVAQVIDEEDAWNRMMIYSTEAAYQRAFTAYPKARLFESRDTTRQRLVNVALARQCLTPPSSNTWVGFEYKRTLNIIEKFTLGEGRSEVNALMWTPESVACFTQNPNVRIVAFGIHNEPDYRTAACLGVYAVLADSPRKMSALKEKLGRSLSCKD